MNATVPSTRRVPGTGNLARWVTLPFWGIAVLSIGPDYFEQLLAGRFVLEDETAGLILFISGAFFVLRGPWWGVWVTSESVVVRSYFVTRRYPIDSHFQCGFMAFEGTLNAGNADGSGRWLKALAFNSYGHARLKPAFGTLVWGARRAQRHVDEILHRVEARLHYTKDN
jgi:hypothetical protein